jgi:protein-S-isoprenylcysteine O-methyltransferase Ste14
MTTKQTTSHGELWVLVQIILLGAILLVPSKIGFLPSFPESLEPLLLVVGILIAGLGLLLVAFSGLFLGGNLTIFPRPKSGGALVQSGVYAFVRHPMYGGVLLCALGWSLFRASIPALLITLILAIFFDRKAAREEIWLTEAYPDYPEYKRRVRKLIPFIY